MPSATRSASSTAASTLPGEADIAALIALVPQLTAYFRRTERKMPPRLRSIYLQHKLAGRHGAVLTQLIYDSDVTISELATRLGVSLPTMSQTVTDLDRAGLIRRRTDPANRRRTLVSLAPRHRAAISQYASIRAAPIVAALQQLPAAQREGFIAGVVIWAREARPQEAGG